MQLFFITTVLAYLISYATVIYQPYNSLSYQNNAAAQSIDSAKMSLVASAQIFIS
jgi:hypothetical protein